LSWLRRPLTGLPGPPQPSRRKCNKRSQLLQVLLEGQDEADMRTARILREAGFLDDRQSFCAAR